jgi:hypothetical protein
MYLFEPSGERCSPGIAKAPKQTSEQAGACRSANNLAYHLTVSGTRTWEEVFEASGKDPNWAAFTVEQSSLVIPKSPSTIRRCWALIREFTGYHEAMPHSCGICGMSNKERS